MKTTTFTKHPLFEQQGYLVVPNLCDASALYEPCPTERGQKEYWGDKEEQHIFLPVERQIPGCMSRYGYPKYKAVERLIKNKIEMILDRKLYSTYYFDRYYFPGQELKKHIDRDACEISVTVHISTNLKGKHADWPIKFETPEGNEGSVTLKPGDGAIYKGCERPHWRDPLPKPHFWLKKEQPYYHQIFFHYVLQDGNRCHVANDAMTKIY